jgi:hypothetical protein
MIKIAVIASTIRTYKTACSRNQRKTIPQMIRIINCGLNKLFCFSVIFPVFMVLNTVYTL